MTWYKVKDKMLLSPKINWQFHSYGFYPEGRGDACWRTGLAVMSGMHIDYPELLEGLKEMIAKRLRYLGDPLPKPIKGHFPHQRHEFSRDQWICGIAGLHEASPSYFKKNVKIPVRLSRRYGWRPDVLFWSLYLKHDRKWLKRLYLTFAKIDLIIPIRHSYVLHLKCIMAYKVPDKTLNSLLLKRIPEWNLGCRAMVGDGIHYKEVERYRAKSRYQWQMDHFWEPLIAKPDYQYLDEDDPLKLDKRVLIYCYTNK